MGRVSRERNKKKAQRNEARNEALVALGVGRSTAGKRLQDHFLACLELRQQRADAVCASATHAGAAISWPTDLLNGYHYACVLLPAALPSSLRRPGLLATLEFDPAGRQLQADGSEGKGWIIPCHCEADPEDSRIILCEFREKLPLASTMTRRKVTFRPTSLDEDLQQQQQEALRFYAAPRPEKVPKGFLPIQVPELLDVFERAIFGDLSTDAKQLEASKFAPVSAGPSQPMIRGLNAAQERAVYKAATSPVSFIQGPQGSGKTKTAAALARIILELAPAADRQRTRVLLVAPTNVAADQLAIEAAAALGSEAQVLRYTRKNSVPPPRVAHLSLHRKAEQYARGQLQGNRAQSLTADKRQQLESFVRLTTRKVSGNFGGRDQILLNQQAGKLTWDVVRANRIICCAASTAGSRSFHDSAFCHVIIDDASMISLPMAMIPIFKVKGVQRVTFIGDPSQSLEITESEEGLEGEESLRLDPFSLLEKSVLHEDSRCSRELQAVLRPSMLV